MVIVFAWFKSEVEKFWQMSLEVKPRVKDKFSPKLHKVYISDQRDKEKKV